MTEEPLIAAPMYEGTRARALEVRSGHMAAYDGPYASAGAFRASVERDPVDDLGDDR